MSTEPTANEPPRAGDAATDQPDPVRALRALGAEIDPARSLVDELLAERRAEADD